jgi:hypothetical protein
MEERGRHLMEREGRNLMEQGRHLMEKGEESNGLEGGI